MSCQERGKEMLSKDGFLSLNIVSEQSTISRRTRRLLRRSLRLPNENGHKARQGFN